MEQLAGCTEFLCLRCGLQGLCEAEEPDSLNEWNVYCPKCGDQVITTHSLAMKREEASLALV